MFGFIPKDNDSVGGDHRRREKNQIIYGEKEKTTSTLEYYYQNYTIKK